MPKVGNIHFPYTPAGKLKAKAFADKTDQKVTHKRGGSVKKKKKKEDWISKVNKSIKKRGTKGKCTPITKPGCKGPAKTLAKTFIKMAKKRKGKKRKA
jgi:hypothetical protein